MAADSETGRVGQSSLQPALFLTRPPMAPMLVMHRQIHKTRACNALSNNAVHSLLPASPMLTPAPHLVCTIQVFSSQCGLQCCEECRGHGP